jgi:hypothetical protein
MTPHLFRPPDHEPKPPVRPLPPEAVPWLDLPAVPPQPPPKPKPQ